MAVAPSLFDTLIVGGGLLGASVADGLARHEDSVCMLDGGDDDQRASRGNFGLAWVQGKGSEHAEYARWTALAADTWPSFAHELCRDTGIDINLQQTGGLDFCLTEQEWHQRAAQLQRVHEHTHGGFTFDMLDTTAVQARFPGVSSNIAGASFSCHDAHLDPLRLLRALHARFQASGGVYKPRHKVLSIEAAPEHFIVRTTRGSFESRRLILCAGLDNRSLAEALGLELPLRANQGQLMITERVPPLFNVPSIHVRQTQEGTLQIGDSQADRGRDDVADSDVFVPVAQRVLRIFPALAAVRVTRVWAALRVLTEDGSPIYHASRRYPGAFVINCHSGVTLAPLHSSELPAWLISTAKRVPRDGDHTTRPRTVHDKVHNRRPSDEVATLIKAFSNDRFTHPA